MMIDKPFEQTEMKPRQILLSESGKTIKSSKQNAFLNIDDDSEIEECSKLPVQTIIRSIDNAELRNDGNSQAR